MLLGAGRATKESQIDPAAGITLLKKPGDRIEKGEAMMVLHANNPELFEAAVKEIDKAVRISSQKPADLPLILDIIE